ncbi:MAG: MFS transporter [SAR324 cluster bacterium]|nr:MFS transporter [SAR324 cluster bacterium]
MFNRNIIVLGLSQACAMSGAPMVILLGGIIGGKLAPYPSWATLPIAIMIVGVATFTVPASFIMKKIGRRYGFMSAIGVAAIAALGGAYAIHIESFLLFCIAILFMGGNIAFIQQYRFAAVESVDPSYAGKAISFVLLCGIVGGFIGPEVGKRGKDLLEYGEYTGSFVGISALYLLTAVMLFFFQDIKPKQTHIKGGEEERPLWSIVVQPLYFTAILGAAIGYGTMSLIMTATPISMHVMDGYSLKETAWVIQSHVVAMYLPSLFTGQLVQRFGVLKIMMTGVLLLFICLGIALLHEHLIHYWGSLVLLGVGWNFLFVGGTILLTQNYRPVERFKAQATNDFLVFGIQAFTSLSAGTLIYLAGWNILILIPLPVLSMLLFILLIRNKATKVAL